MIGMKNKKGFTLAELLAVIVILAIIAGIAVPAYNRIKSKTNEKQYKNKLDLIKVAALKYADDTNYTAFYLEADKIKKQGDEKLYLELDNRDNTTIMNCYTIIIQDRNGVLDASIDEKLAEQNKNYEANGCAANLPNSVSEYFDIKLEEEVSSGNWEELTYDKYYGWWTRNNVRITIEDKNKPGEEVKPVEAVTWYEGASTEEIASTNENYNFGTPVEEIHEDGSRTTTNRSIEIGKTVSGVLQQNYTAKVKIDKKEYMVTTRIYIDRINPKFYLNSNNVSNKWTKKVNYAISAYDNESQLLSYFVEKVSDTQTACNCPSDRNNEKWSGEKRKEITENGTYCACLIDNVGNTYGETLKFQNIDTAEMACNLETTGEQKNPASGWYTNNVTILLRPKLDGTYTIGPSGIKTGVNTKALTWPTTSPNYVSLSRDDYNNPNYVGLKTAYAILDAEPANGVATYYGHIGNEAGENSLCVKRVKLEKNIAKPTFTECDSGS